MDLAGIIDPSDARYLESQMRRLYQQQDIQVQILTLRSLQGETIEQVSIDTAEAWKLGSEEEDKGILIVVAPSEKKVRIEVGQGLEGDIPDILAHQIIQQKILPEFRNGHYGKGLIAAVGAIESLSSPETAQVARKSFEQRGSRQGEASLFKFIIFIIAFLILTSLGGGGGRRRRRSSANAFLLGAMLGGMGRHRGGFGGGGWSGGGGGFSGGGASGGW